jgi:hypothetical protein
VLRASARFDTGTFDTRLVWNVPLPSGEEEAGAVSVPPSLAVCLAPDDHDSTLLFAASSGRGDVTVALGDGPTQTVPLVFDGHPLTVLACACLPDDRVAVAVDYALRIDPLSGHLSAAYGSNKLGTLTIWSLAVVVVDLTSGTIATAELFSPTRVPRVGFYDGGGIDWPVLAAVARAPGPVTLAQLRTQMASESGAALSDDEDADCDPICLLRYRLVPTGLAGKAAVGFVPQVGLTVMEVLVVSYSFRRSDPWKSGRTLWQRRTLVDASQPTPWSPCHRT